MRPGGPLGGLFAGLELGMRPGQMPKYTKTEEEMVEIARRLTSERVTMILSIASVAAGHVGVAAQFPDLLTVTSQIFEEMIGRTRMAHCLPFEEDDPDAPDSGPKIGMRKPVDLRPGR